MWHIRGDDVASHLAGGCERAAWRTMADDVARRGADVATT